MLEEVGRVGYLGSDPAGRKTVSAIRLPNNKTLTKEFELKVNLAYPFGDILYAKLSDYCEECRKRV